METNRHQMICENHIYTLLNDKIKSNISEDEFNNILEELSYTSLSDDEINSFMEFTLPRVIEIDKYGIELVHELSKMLMGVENSSKLKDTKIIDILNWVKSDLSQEVNQKLGKTNTPYRQDKIKFLNKLKDLIEIT